MKNIEELTKPTWFKKKFSRPLPLLYGIQVIQGKFGSGKTLLGVKDIIANGNKKNTYIFTNIKYNFKFNNISYIEDQNFLELLEGIEKFVNEYREKYGTDELRKISIKIYFDEAAILFNNKTEVFKDKNKLKRIVNLLYQLRKIRVKLVFIIQQAERIDKIFRDNIYQVIEPEPFLFRFLGINKVKVWEPEEEDGKLRPKFIENIDQEGKKIFIPAVYDTNIFYRPKTFFGYYNDLYLNRNSAIEYTENHENIYKNIRNYIENNKNE